MSGEIVDAALEYVRRGWCITPTAGKAPILENWPNVRLDEEGVRRTFTPQHNVGVVLGASGLADLDFDDEVASRACELLAPAELEGAAVFEHACRAHVVVRSPGVETRKFKRANGSTLLELRGAGAQTLFPPSVHPDGQPYGWVHNCDPCEVPAGRLQLIAATIATAAYASEFWSQGSRHDLSLALAGFLAPRLPEPDVLAVVRAAASLAGDRELADREKAVLTTIRRMRGAKSVAGLEKLKGLAPELVSALASWWQVTLDRKADEKPTGQAASSQADVLVEIGRTAELFHDPTGMAFVRLRVVDHLEIWPVLSKRFKNWLRREYYLKQGKVPGSDAVHAACDVLEGIAVFGGPEHELHNRVALLDGAIYYDLADSRWRAVRVDASGWQVIEQPPILFRRYAHQRPQVEPVAGGDLSLLLDFLNVRAEDQLLLLVSLVTDFLPDIPHPIVNLHGEKGSAKTTGQRVMRRLIDPSVIETLSFPEDRREVVQQLSHHYAPVYDNVDHLDTWLSDLLCRAVTGEGFSKRELYSDDDDIIYSYRRVVLLNGVNVAPARPDLLDRTILVGLKRITRSKRREENEFWADFEQARPRILGAIFDALSGAMRIYPGLKIPALERMADFNRWGVAISEAMGMGGHSFLDAYAANIGVQTAEAVESHLVGAAVLELMRDRGEWSGSPTELLIELEEVGEDAKLFKRSASGKVDAKRWPGAPHILSRRLNEIRSNLLDIGLEIIEERSDKRLVKIRKTAAQWAESSVSSVSSVDSDSGELDSSVATDAFDATFSRSRVDEKWEAVIE